MTSRPETAESKKPEPWSVSNLLAKTVSESLSGATFAWFLDAKVSKGAWIGAVGGAGVWAATNLYDHLTKEEPKKPASALPDLSIIPAPEKVTNTVKGAKPDTAAEIFGKFLVTDETKIRKPWER